MQIRFKRFKFILLGGLALATSVTSRSAQAYPFYFDAQGGVGQYYDTNTLFKSGTSSTTSFGGSAAFGFFYSPFESKSMLDVQFGLQSLFVSTSQSVQSASLLTEIRYYSTLTAYPMVRLQFWIFYAGVGYSPLIWRRSETSGGIENFSIAQGAYGILGDAGILYAMTPKFSAGAGTTLQFLGDGSTLSSKPAFSIHFVMRFYFSMLGIGTDGPSAQNSTEFSGWRYIGK